MKKLLTLLGLLAFTLQAWGAAQWQNISYSTNPVTYAVITNVMGFTGSTTTYLRSDGTQATPAGTGSYAVTNYFITPSTGITVATNVTGTNVTWTLSSTVVGGGNMTNSGASVIGMVPVATDTTGTQWTPTNSISLDDVIAGTLSLSNMLANVVPVFDANTNMVPSSMTTNVLDLLYSQSGNITNWGKLTTNEFLPLAGGTVTGPVLSTSPTTNGPTTLELATAGWVRSLLANGSLLYNSTNLVGTAFDASTYLYVGSEPTNGSRSYTPSAGDYIGTVMTTNRYEEVVGPVHITTFFTSSGGAASAQYTLHPEIYYTYDTNSATLLGDYASAPQAITHGAITNQYDFVVSFPPIINTNTPGNGFYIVRRFKIDTKTGTDTLKLSLGTNGVNNTSSHIAFSQPEIAGANWVASGTTNSTLAGDAQPYSVTMGGTNVIGALAGKQAASTVLTHYAGTDTNNILAAIGGAALAGATFTGDLAVTGTNVIGALALKAPLASPALTGAPTINGVGIQQPVSALTTTWTAANSASNYVADLSLRGLLFNMTTNLNIIHTTNGTANFTANTITNYMSIKVINNSGTNFPVTWPATWHTVGTVASGHTLTNGDFEAIAIEFAGPTTDQTNNWIGVAYKQY